MYLGEQRGLVRHVHPDMHQRGPVERFVVDRRQIARARREGGEIGETHSLGEYLSSADVVLGQVDAEHVASVVGRRASGGPADAGADIKQPGG